MSDERELRVKGVMVYRRNAVPFFEGAQFLTIFAREDLPRVYELFDPAVILECDSGRCGDFTPEMVTRCRHMAADQKMRAEEKEREAIRSGEVPENAAALRRSYENWGEELDSIATAINRVLQEANDG